MKFRTTVLIGVLALVVGLLVSTVGAVAVLLDRSARSGVADALKAGQRVFEDLQSYRVSLFRSEARVVAEEPRLKAVVATQEVTRETVLGVALDLRKAVGADLFLLTDGRGRLVADVADPSASGFDLSSNPAIASALQRGEGAGIWTHEQHAYQVQARRLAFGDTVVGVLVLGYELDDRVAQTIYQQTTDSVVVELGGQPIAASPLDGGARPDRSVLAAQLQPIKEGAEPQEIALAGVRYLAVAFPFPGHDSAAQPMRYVLLRSLDRALAAWRTISRALFALAAAALLAALLLAARLSRFLSRPIDDLLAFTHRIAAGDLDGSARIGGPVELATLGVAMNRMVEELAESRRQMAEKARLHQELEIATRIQTSILPREVAVEGLEIAARMQPADEVGGDYYDIIPVRGGAWIGVGDVAGHGLTAGLVMMMIQSIVAALVVEEPETEPREILRVLNTTLYENIRRRLMQDEHVTLTLVRYLSDGSMVFSGAHEEIVVCRARDGRCERIATPGTWLGAAPDVTRFMVDSRLSLEPGDLVALYTDGLIQAMDRAGEQFGMDRMCAEIEQARTHPVDAIRDQVLEAVRRFAARQDDDITLLILRYTGAKA